MSSSVNMQAIDFSVSTPSASRDLTVAGSTGCRFNEQYAAWQLEVNGASMNINFNLNAPVPPVVRLTINACSMTLGPNPSNNPITVKVNGTPLVTGFDDHVYNFHDVAFSVTQGLKQGNNTISLSLDPNATSKFSFKSVGVWGIVLPRQSVDLRVPNPSASSQLSLPLYQGAMYNGQYTAWQLTYPGAFMQWAVQLSEPCNVVLDLNTCSMLVGGVSNNPITIRVNDNPVVTGWDDHVCNFHDTQFVIPASMTRAGRNDVVVSLDSSASTKISFWTVGVVDDVLPAQTVSFETPNPKQTTNLSLPQYQGCEYNPQYNAWWFTTGGAPMKFNLSLTEPVDVKWTQNVCSMLVRGESNNPMTLKVNGHTVFTAYDDHGCNFHEQSWTLPYSWLRTGDNEVVLSLDPNATTKCSLKYVSVSGGLAS